MNPIIEVENLSKLYQIGAKEAYGSLRDEIMQAVTAPFRRLKPKTVNLTPNTDTDTTLWALKDVSFEVNEGEVVGIIGRNGAGKSTLLKILSRITEPTSGKITMRGRVASLLEVGTGFHPELTGRENIFLNGALLGMTQAEIRRKFDEIVAFSEIEKFLDTPVKRYSSGMYVRLAFAVAAHLEPEILVVDEVLAVGDAQFQKKCMGKMGAVAKGGRTVLFVSHNMGAVNRLCSKSILLEKGRLILSGDTQDVIKGYMSSNTSKSSIYEMEHNPRKEMNLRRVVLNPDNEDRTADVRYDRPIAIRIEYEVNNKVSNCGVWMALQTMEGVMVFTTADYDLNSEMLQERLPGYYKTDVTIPEKWLNVGEYNVIVGVVKNNPVIVYNREETLTFNVVEVGTPGSVLKEGVRRGVLQPFLKWELSEHNV